MSASCGRSRRPRLRADALRQCKLTATADCDCAGIIIRAMQRTILSLGALVLGCSAAALVAQQQAAEAPATDRRVQTRPAVAGLHGLVAAGHPIASSAGL